MNKLPKPGYMPFDKKISIGFSPPQKSMKSLATFLGSMTYFRLLSLPSFTSLIPSPPSQASDASPSTPTPTPTSISPNTYKPCPLLSLPLEILLMILRSLLLSPFPIPLSQKCRQPYGSVEALHPWPIQPHPNVSWTPEELYRHPPSTGILFTCRALYTIGSEIYYPRNDFVIRIGCLRRFIAKIPRRVLFEIRSLEVRCEEQFADWELWPLLSEFRGLERLAVEPPRGLTHMRWNHFSGMTHVPGGAPETIVRAGHNSSGDILKDVCAVTAAEVSPGEQARAQSTMEEVVRERTPKLTRFWIKRRESDSRVSCCQSPFSNRLTNPRDLVEANNRAVEFDVMAAICLREQDATGMCTSEHTVKEEFCCEEYLSRMRKVDREYRPMEARLLPSRRSENVKPWEGVAFGLPEDGWREGWLEEDVWGVDNTKILRRRYEKPKS